MKKILFILVFSFNIQLSYTQNLVDNYSFETVLSGYGNSCSQWLSYNSIVDCWNEIPPWGVPEHQDSWDPLCLNSLVGTPDCKNDGGHTGEHYGFAGNGEYIVAPLNTTIIMGHIYYIEMYVSGGVAESNGGLKLFEDRPSQCGGHNISPDGIPQLAIPAGTNISNWTKISTTIVADNYYNWFALGSFNNTPHGYNFDDITIIDVGSSACPPYNLIQNAHFQDIGKITYPSQYITKSGKNVVGSGSQGNVVIGSNALVEFKSATKVVLEDGFSTEDGAYFEARIAPCGAECFPVIANAGANQESCNGQTLQLGTTSEFGVTYTWTANPSSALSYLSHSNISNPIFTPPPTGHGSINYTLTVSNECGLTTTDHVLIYYENNPNNNPSQSVSNINYTDLINFDVNFGSQTDQILIEVCLSNGTHIHTYTYNLGIDFNCCVFHWQIPSATPPCSDYLIKVSTKNMCSTVLSSPSIINWTRNRVPTFIQVANYMTPNYDGDHDSWCFEFSGAVYYSVEIKNPSGVAIYNNSNFVYPPLACVWSGECNQTACSSSFVENGWYYYTLDINGCDNSSVETVGFIYVTMGLSPISVDTNATTDTLNDQAFILPNKDVFNSEIYPNPNNGSFLITVTKNAKPIGVKEIKVYDIMGKEIWQTGASTNNIFNIDISQYSKGIYYVRSINEAGEMQVKKLVKE